MAQPWPPGDEPGVPDADLGTVKAPGAELARVWPDGPPGEEPAAREQREEPGSGRKHDPGAHHLAQQEDPDV